jgi:hypothetical protein
VDLVQRAIAAVGHSRILGVILNRADAPQDGSHDSYYSSYYGPKGGT